MSRLTKKRLTRRESEGLRTLDHLCYADAEAGGGGWATLEDFAEAHGVGDVWARQLLGYLQAYGLVEKRYAPDGSRKLYALTEQGATFLTQPNDQPLDQGEGER